MILTDKPKLDLRFQERLSRKEFGIVYGSSVETGGIVLGDEIKINAEIQLIKQVKNEPVLA